MECKNCEKKFTEKYSKWSSGDFCSKKCARSFVGKQLKGTKLVYCIDCEKEIEVDKRASEKLCKCDNCRKRKKYKQENNENCLYCRKKLKKSKGKFCNHFCQQQFKYQEFIQRWKDGKEKGNRSHFISRYIKRYLLEKYQNKCSKCGWGEINKFSDTLPLEVEHIDGNSENNKEENLTLLCPNCHSLTSTYKGANKGNGRFSRRKRYSEGKSY